MKRFSSRYEKIRRLRSQQEDICRAAAAARNAERNTLEQARDAKQRWLETIERAAATDISNGLSGALLNSIASEIDRGKHELRASNDVLKAAEERLREALEQHKHARAELKIVEYFDLESNQPCLIETPTIDKIINAKATNTKIPATRSK